MPKCASSKSASHSGVMRGDCRSLHFHSVGAPGRRGDRLDSWVPRRERRVRRGTEATGGPRKEVRRKKLKVKSTFAFCLLTFTFRLPSQPEPQGEHFR